MIGTKGKTLTCILTAVVMIFVLLFSMTGCGASGENQSSDPPGTVISETEKEITIVDQAQRKVTVPKNVKSTAFCYRVVARFIINLGRGDTIKGMGKQEDFLYAVQPSLKKAKDVGQGVADIEALANLEPDLFIHKSNDAETLDSVQKLGIPSVGVTFETPEDMIVALDIMGKVLSAEKKAKKLISYYEKKLDRDEKLVAKLKDKDRKTAIVMGSGIGKVADGSMLQGFMINEAGGINCADDLDATETWPTVGTESIFKWNPDFIFISGSESTNYSKEDLMNDKTWSDVSAVKNDNIYVIPAEEDSWEFPGVVSVLGIDYMMHKMYPEILSEKQLRKNIDEFYELSYGRVFTDAEIGYSGK